MKIDEMISRILPESKYKEILRKIYYNNHNNLYILDGMIEEFNLQQDKTLFVKLDDGLSFYGIPDQTKEGISCWIKYGNKKKLNKIRKYCDFSSFFMQLSEQFVQGIYERKYKIKEGDTVIDIGACMGINAIPASKEVGDKGRVIAIEPDKDNIMCLEKNITINKLNNVTIIRKGVWNNSDKMNFYVKKSPDSHSLVIQKDDVRKITEIEVDTLDDILKDLNIDKVDFVKMDIEGAEIEALKGMKETLSNNDVKMAIASYHIVDEQPTYKTIIPMMKKIGFDSYFKGGITYFWRK